MILCVLSWEQRMFLLELVLRMWDTSLNGDSNHSRCLTRNTVSGDNKLHFSSLKHSKYGRLESGGSLIWSTLRETLSILQCIFSCFSKTKYYYYSVRYNEHTKEYLNRKKICQAGKSSKFLALMIPKAEGPGTERVQYIGAKIKLVLNHTSGEYSELYLIKYSHTYIVNQKFPTISVQFTSL